jgi:radical SAM protein with 4Fe4S-binding SPASM domain
MDYFRFDPFLHYRFDRDADRNAEIGSERLTPTEVVSIERSDRERRRAMEKSCGQLIVPAFKESDGRRLFRCDAGRRSFVVGADGRFRPCASLYHPDFLYDLRRGSLADAWNDFAPAVLSRTSDRPEYLKTCARCPVVNLCLWCPAHAYLETGVLDLPVDKFCQMAHARAKALQRSSREKC